jgi:hypothetical protein
MNTLTLMRLRHNTLKLMRRNRVWLIDSPYAGDFPSLWWRP